MTPELLFEYILATGTALILLFIGVVLVLSFFGFGDND